MDITHRPFIGINLSLERGKRNTGYDLRIPLNYVDAVISAGGIPLCIPPVEDDVLRASILPRLDGTLFIGGDDYRPEHYGGHPQPPGDLMPERRDRFDMALARRVLEDTGLPILGICGGHQLLCIARGGSLIQDIGSEWTPPAGQVVLPHSGNNRHGGQKNRFRHPVRMAPGSLIASITQLNAAATLQTNSFHHQAVDPDHPGIDWRVTAWTADGIVEAIEPSPDSIWSRTGRFILGVQWHPEQLQSEGPHRNLFAAFIRAAQKTMPET